MFPEATIVRPSVLVGTEDRIFNEYAKIAKLAPLFPLPDGGQGKLQPVRPPGFHDARSCTISAKACSRHRGKWSTVECAGASCSLPLRPTPLRCAKPSSQPLHSPSCHAQVYVRDVATAIVEALKSKATVGKVIELAGPKVYTYEYMF